MARTRDYVIRRPRAAAVRARDCDRCNGGWDTWCNEAQPIGRAAARYIRDAGGFAYRELSATAADALAAGILTAGEIDPAIDPRTPVTLFRFSGGQPCFDHPGPAKFIAGGRIVGDLFAGGYVAGGREHTRMADWIEDLDEHAGRLAEQAEKG